MPTKNIPTGYANSKRRVIFTSPGGKAYSRTPAGKKVYAPKAKFALNNNGSTRVIKKASLSAVPNSIRPKRAPAKSPAKKQANVFKAMKKAASPSKRSPAKTVRKTVRLAGLPVAPSGRAREGPGAGYTEKGANGTIMRRSGRVRLRKSSPAKTVRKVSPTIANVRANLARRGYTKKAAAKVAPLVKKGMPSNRYSKTTGMVKGRGPRRAYRNPAQKSRSPLKRKPASIVKRSVSAVKRVARRPVSASLKAGQTFAKMMNRLTAKPRKMAMNTVRKVTGGNNKPKARKNKGVGRALVASPGGTLYKGRAALTRRQKSSIKKNAISIANSIKKMLK